MNGGPLADQAYWMLRSEFIAAFAADPATTVSTPASEAHEEQPVVAAVCDLLAHENNHSTLARMLKVVQSAVDVDDSVAQTVVQSLAHRFATEQCNALAARGAFGGKPKTS